MRRRNFFSPTSRSSQGSEGFFSDELHTRSRTWKPLNSARAGLSLQVGDVRRRKEDDQGRWSVATRRRREKVHEKKETKEGKKVAPRVLGPWAAFKEQARLTSLL